MLDSLPAEQKQPFIDHFVKSILGKADAPLILSTSKTVSNDGSLEERIKQTAAIYGIDPQRIDREEFLLGEQEIAASKFHVKEIIQEHLYKENTTGQRSKNDELISLGKFLYTTQMKFEIEPTEVPDFILTSEKLSIGVEHSRLEEGKAKAYIAELWKKYLNPTLALILAETHDLTGVGNLTLDTDIKLYDDKSLRDFNNKVIKSNSLQIIKELADFIMATIRGTSPVIPVFVKTFSYQPSNELFCLRYNQDYFVRNDFTDMVVAGVQKKEKRLNAYRQNTNIDECWLLLVYGDASLSSGFKVSEQSLTTAISSSFDRVFILNAFNQACFELQRDTAKLVYVAQKQFRELKIKPIAL
ncbi:hypothetical protein ACPPVU_24965 [Mucilaginibacter sp. McL0603]|uniref:hypothetical protein n=1 Tax=Mucilaginibacter sp. McL0603 TaxID=3415670 RepID=UPI003CF0C466